MRLMSFSGGSGSLAHNKNNTSYIQLSIGVEQQSRAAEELSIDSIHAERWSADKGARRRTGSEEAVEKVAGRRTGRNVEKGTTEKKKGVVHRT